MADLVDAVESLRVKIAQATDRLFDRQLKTLLADHRDSVEVRLPESDVATAVAEEIAADPSLLTHRPKFIETVAAVRERTIVVQVPAPSLPASAKQRLQDQIVDLVVRTLSGRKLVSLARVNKITRYFDTTNGIDLCGMCLRPFFRARPQQFCSSKCREAKRKFDGRVRVEANGAARKRAQRHPPNRNAVERELRKAVPEYYRAAQNAGMKSILEYGSSDSDVRNEVRKKLADARLQAEFNELTKTRAGTGQQT
jgi:hypothetical protein